LGIGLTLKICRFFDESQIELLTEVAAISIVMGLNVLSCRFFVCRSRNQSFLVEGAITPFLEPSFLTGFSSLRREHYSSKSHILTP
jgi:hypothetical protein